VHLNQLRIVSEDKLYVECSTVRGKVYCLNCTLIGKISKVEKGDDDDDDEADLPEVCVKPCKQKFYVKKKDKVSQLFRLTLHCVKPSFELN